GATSGRRSGRLRLPPAATATRLLLARFRVRLAAVRDVRAARVALRPLVLHRLGGAVGAQRPRGFEPGDGNELDFLLQQAADVAQQALLLVRDQRDRQAFRTGAAG